jgi:hypothetical protein
VPWGPEILCYDLTCRGDLRFCVSLLYYLVSLSVVSPLFLYLIILLPRVSLYCLSVALNVVGTVRNFFFNNLIPDIHSEPFV